MKLSTQLLVPVMALATACGGSGSGNPADPPTGISNLSLSRVMPTDQQIAALVYDSSYSVPDGFYIDERAGTERSYTIHHVLDDSSSYERCTDDYAVALAWEDADNASRSVQGYFVESYDNARYFEFVRELAYENDVGNIDDITSPGFARVFKCSNTNRDGVVRSELTGYAGALNAQPLDRESVRVFAEYLWQFTFFPTRRKTVVDSYGGETESSFEQTLLLAFSRSQGADSCDLVEVAEWTFSADRHSGEVTKMFSTSHYFEAMVENGQVVLCG